MHQLRDAHAPGVLRRKAWRTLRAALAPYPGSLLDTLHDAGHNKKQTMALLLYQMRLQKLYDLLLVSQAAAKSNGRDVIRPWDLPLTKGLQESMHAFRELDEELELAPILEQLAKLPQLDLEYDEEVRAMLPQIVGGLTVALAWTFWTLDPDVKNPDTTHWDRAIEIFNRLL